MFSVQRLDSSGWCNIRLCRNIGLEGSKERIKWPSKQTHLLRKWSRRWYNCHSLGRGCRAPCQANNTFAGYAGYLGTDSPGTLPANWNNNQWSKLVPWYIWLQSSPEDGLRLTVLGVLRVASVRGEQQQEWQHHLYWVALLDIPGHLTLIYLTTNFITNLERRSSAYYLRCKYKDPTISSPITIIGSRWS